jgi:hypothetical protein
MKKLQKLCYKSSIKPELNYVKVSGDTMEATDSFRWARVKNKGYKDGYHKKDDYKEELNYPDVNIILEGVKKDNTRVFTVNRKFMIEVLEALEKGEGADTVKMYINPSVDNRPIYFTNSNGEGLLMPIAF